MRKALSQTGDTIVEVLISCAATALILTSAFYLANQSTKATRQAQERGEALNIAQGQLENFTNGLINGGSISFNGNAFCLEDPDPADTPPIAKFVSFGSVLPPADVSTYPAECIRRGLYGIAITHSTLTSTYDITVTWPSVKGNGNDNVVLSVRNYGN